MRLPIVFMFSGQGSQYYQMGREFYEKNQRFRLWMDHCDSIASPLIHASIIDILYSQANKSEAFDNILHTNPALISIQYSMARVLMEQGIFPDYLLGYSLGEFVSMIVSGVISLEAGIGMVVQYAKLLQQEGVEAEMLAVINPIDIIEKNPDIFKDVWVTGINFSNNFVVCGFPQHVSRLQAHLASQQIISQKLPVKYGFHTPLIESLKPNIIKLTESVVQNKARIPVISSAKGSVIELINPDHLWEVTRQPVNFSETIFSLLKQGDYIFIDISPSGTLATFIKYLLPSQTRSMYFESLNAYGRDVLSVEKLRLGVLNVAQQHFVC